MSNTSKNLVSFAIAMATMAIIFWGLGRYIDKNYGNGTSGMVGAVLIGVVIAVTIMALTMMLNNRTHQSAGDDITAFAGAMAKVDAQRARAFSELARAEREVNVIEAKKGLITHKSETFTQREVEREARRLLQKKDEDERRRQAAEAADDQAAEWYYADVETDSDVELQ